MKSHGQIGGFFWFFLGIGICIGALKLKVGVFANPGAGFMPFLTGLMIWVLGLILVVLSYSKENKEANYKEIFRKGKLKNFLFIFLILLILSAYILTMKQLGFLLATFLFFIFLFKLSEPRKWLIPLFLSLSSAILSYLLFCVLLQCQFPKGLFGF